MIRRKVFLLTAIAMMAIASGSVSESKAKSGAFAGRVTERK